MTDHKPTGTNRNQDNDVLRQIAVVATEYLNRKISFHEFLDASGVKAKTQSEDEGEQIIMLAMVLIEVTRTDVEHWYRYESIPSIGMTAKEAVAEGAVEAVISHIFSTAAGGYA